MSKRGVKIMVKPEDSDENLSAETPAKRTKRAPKAVTTVPAAVFSSLKPTPPSEDDQSPFPGYLHPSQEECVEARNGLALLHSYESSVGASNTGLEKAARSPQSVLDSLVRTMLSQNTTDKTSLRAFLSLKAAFPTWEEVMAAPSRAVEDAIREGGLAEIKTERIKAILSVLKSEVGKLSLEHLRDQSTEEVKKQLSRFKGVGPKTISCVLMFTLGRHEFPVDTHVWRISKRLGWVPQSATREQTYMHLNGRVPGSIKYDLHVLLVDHGKRCTTCLGKNGRLSKESHGPCPLRRSGTLPLPAKGGYVIPDAPKSNPY